MKLVLGKFALTGIEALSGRDLPAGLQRALRHYVSRERSTVALGELERRFLEQQVKCGDHLELALDTEIEEALERRAHEQGGVTVEQLAAHAVLAYLADRDAQPAAS